MKKISELSKNFWGKEQNRKIVSTLLFIVAFSSLNAFCGSPWETAVENLKTTMTGPIAKGLSLVAVVVGGLMFAYGEGGSKKALAGVIFGTGMAVGAVNFLTWLGIL